MMNFKEIYKKISPEQFFMITILFVNAGNYLYNLLLGRILGPSQFADAAILITLLLVLSFVGMTFQVVAAKYSVLFKGEILNQFIKFIFKRSLISGLLFGFIIILFHQQLQQIFHTKTALMFVIFGVGLPLYFVISINRGLYQGKNNLKSLSQTYNYEMLCRLILTITIILLFPSIQSSLVIAFGILISFFCGLFPFQKSILNKDSCNQNERLDTKPIITFFALTAFYELTQIIINNSDILLVKHYFNNEQAGLYASLALIGRVVYFVAWMFVMLLLPKVIQLKKDGADTLPILLKYVFYIVLLSAFIVLGTFLFPELVVKIMFGKKYLPIAFLLWKYALATSIFAVANIFAYYFLSINKYVPVIISAILGLTQILLIVSFHNSLEQVVIMQIIAMIILLAFQLCYFLLNINIKAKLPLN
jgi:O-antigen/teichoic acid export membrane protein